MKAGDICVQRGTMHAWVAKGLEPAVFAFVLIDEVAFALEADRVVEGFDAVHELPPRPVRTRPPETRCPGPSRVIVADDVSANTRVECPKVPTELRLREPLIDSGGGSSASCCQGCALLKVLVI
jgi:hypothetical protein